ncbi:MAG: DNA mismatch repair endonuclease MutL [Candidatus Gracilibacteria bacterium]|nr:DNA mismatch repair endonuclease MutL [Candidatus Gracilibacteria bacterium]
MKIHILPSEVSDQIAAGEVVERPSSVVKELVENAIDAGATDISVRFEQGGKTLLEVADNGTGMTPEDAEKSILRHATSKIASIDDIFSIRSFGFRGEALAAISSVSDFTLVTREKSFDAGTKLSLSAGKNLKISPAPANIGTTVTVRNLFSPTPARLAHLKTDATESAAIVREVESFALSYPQISFRVERDRKEIRSFPPEDSKARAAQILKEPVEQLLEVSQKIGDVQITGFVSQPGACVSQKKFQWISVNGRRIEDWRIAHAVREAYQQSAGIEKHLHPKFTLSLTLDPILVDVNVHPRKLEVKFSEPGEIWRAVKNATMFALSKTNASFSQTRALEPGLKSHHSQTASPSPKHWRPPTAPRAFDFSRQNFERDLSFSPEETTSEIAGELKLIGQVAQKYVVAEDARGVWFFDQHALHERERFERFWNEREKLLQSRQKLLLPHELKLDETEAEQIAAHLNELETLGFSVSEKLVVTEIPSLLAEENLDEVFADFVEFFATEKVREHFTEKLLRKMLEYKSCRGAVMFGDRLEREEMQRLLDDFARTQWRNLCPHGRPNHWFVPFEELDQKFHR